MTPHLTPNRSFSFARLGSLALQAVGAQPIDDREWQSYIDCCVRDLREHGLAEVVVQYVAGPGPSAAQLLGLAQAMGEAGLPHRSATITDSPRVRGSVVALRTALRVNLDLRTYAPGFERQALDWLAEHRPFDVERGIELLRVCAEATGVHLGRR